MRDSVRRWIVSAYSELQAGWAALDQELPGKACFHAHQCVEKSLKGLLVWEGVTVPQTHSIAELIEAVSCALLCFNPDDLRRMDNCYTSARSPDARQETSPSGVLTSIDAKNAMMIAELIMETAFGVTGFYPE